jgi:hypothetical protein
MAATFMASSERVYFTNTGGSQTITFEGVIPQNLSYNISSGGNFISVSISGNTATITTSSYSGDYRSGSIMFYDPYVDGNTIDVYVYQRRWIAIPSYIKLDKTGDTINVQFSGSVPQDLSYSMSAAAEDWVTVTLDGNNTTITVDVNSSEFGRSVNILFYDTNDSSNYFELKVQQFGDLSSWSVNYVGSKYSSGVFSSGWQIQYPGEIEVHFTGASGDVIYAADVEWLKMLPSPDPSIKPSGYKDCYLGHRSGSIISEINDSHSSRTANIAIFGRNRLDSYNNDDFIDYYIGSVQYTQDGIPNTFSVTPDRFSLKYDDTVIYHFDVTLPSGSSKSNLSATVKTDKDHWLKVSEDQDFSGFTNVARYNLEIDYDATLSNSYHKYCVIEVICGNYVKYIPIEWNTSDADNGLYLFPNSLVYNSLGGDIYVWNKYWRGGTSSTITMPSWINYEVIDYTGTSGMTDNGYYLKFTADQNNTGVSRSGDISFTYYSRTDSIPAIQMGSSADSVLSVDPSSMIFKGHAYPDYTTGDVGCVNYAGSVSFTAPSWMDVSLYPVDDTLDMFSVSMAKTVVSRSGDINFTDSNSSVAIPVEQEQGFYTYPSVVRLSSGEDTGATSLVGCYDGVTPVITNSGSIPSWMSVTVTSVVSGQAGCYVSASPNRNTAEGVSEERRFTLEFAAVLSGSTIATTSAKVRQEGGFAGLYCTPSSASFVSGGGSVTMSLSHYGSVTYDSLPDWLSLVETSASGVFQNNYTVTAASNTTNVSRSHSIVFTDDYDSVSFPISQEAGSPGPVPVLSVVPSSLSFVSGGGSESLAVTYNGSLSYNSEEVPGWLSVLSTSVSTGYNTYSVTAASNTGAARSFGLVFTDDDTSVSVPISQAGSTPVPISVSPSSLSFTESGGSSTVTVTSSGSVSYSTLPDWITITNSGGVYTVTAAANTGASRTHTITFTDETGSASVVVSQEASTTVISVSPSTLTFTRNGGYSYVTVTSSGTVSYSTLPDWITITNDGNVYTVTAAANTGSSRTHTITFTDGTGSATLVVSQASEYVGDRYTPIWKNTGYYAHPSDFPDDLAYKITVSSDGYDFGTVYEGYIPFLSASNRDIYVSRLVEDQFPNATDITHFITWGGWPVGSTIIAKIYQKGDPDVLLETYYFIRDWSYYVQGYNTTKTLNDPINGHGCANMTIPYVVFTMGDTSFSLVETSNSGSQSTRTLNTPMLPVYGGLNSFYGDKKVELKGNNNTFVSYDLTYCGSGNLVYRNRFGGYDAFLIEGNIEKKEDYTRDKYNLATVGGYNIDRGLGGDQTLDVHIKTSYTAHTGWLTDDQAERLVFHLLSSPDIYFQSFEGYRYGERHADFNLSRVVITDSSAVYKKFKNGKRMVSYAITFELSDTKKIVY